MLLQRWKLPSLSHDDEDDDWILETADASAKSRLDKLQQTLEASKIEAAKERQYVSCA
jgi:hypothetical protein